MPVFRVMTLVLLSLPAALRGQEHGGQFKDLISWGQSKETFKITLTVSLAPRPIDSPPSASEGAFIVSAHGFRWILIGGSDTATGPIPWENIRSWSCGRSAGLGITTSNGVFAEIGLKREDLLKVVNQYLKKYAPGSLDSIPKNLGLPSPGCTPEQF